ncbi:MAG: FprA family A-type flavoprotein [Chloroflexi bacterium]|nr:FprA family A-type flavoprotein [Chloroflexota bacterium]
MAFEIAKDVYWVGALDAQIRIFDVIMKAPHGTTYNAYLVKGRDKTALIDTVKAKYKNTLLTHLRELIDPKELDYIIINHTEPDHTGALETLMAQAPQARVVISRTAESYLKHLLNRDVAPLKVGDDDVLDLGGRELRFFSTPFLHWPDTMFTYLPQESILFPCDYLGCHFCDERLWDDSVDDFSASFDYYFHIIMRPFKEYSRKALEKITPMDWKLIAPSHGPLLRSNPRRYLELYRRWSQEPPAADRPKSLIVLYASAYGNTGAMAQEIARGAEAAGAKVMVYDLMALDSDPRLVDAVEQADGLAVGSCTINADAVRPVWEFLASLATLRVKGKVGVAFGSYAWSGEAPKLIEERLRGLKLKVSEEALRAHLVPTAEDLAHCRELGERLAKSL